MLAFCSELYYFSSNQEQSEANHSGLFQKGKYIVSCREFTCHCT